MDTTLYQLLILFLLFYVFLIRPELKKAKKHQAMLDALKKGDKVLTRGGLYGVIMHIIATGVLVLVAGSIYKLRHTRTGAVIALICGTICMGLVMMVANHFITPVFMGAPTEVVDAMLLPVILPFNLIKAGINSLITFLVYKTISRHIIHGEGWKKKEKKAELNGEPVE